MGSDPSPRWRRAPVGRTLPPAPTGIDDLHLIEAQRTAELACRLRHSQLGEQPTGPGDGEEVPS